jgi:hypothetical protein
MSCSPVKKISAAVLCLIAILLAPAFAQTAPSSPPHAHQETSPQQDTSMAGMQMDEPMDSRLPSPHESSGTSWQPASVTRHQWMWARGGWDLMAHGVIFIDYNQAGGPRGAGKVESVNWGMLMEQHRLGSGTILFREMFSAESLTSPNRWWTTSIRTTYLRSWRRCTRYR